MNADYEHALVVLGEIVGLRAFQLDNSDHLALVLKRHGQFRPRLGVDVDIPRIREDISGSNGDIHHRCRPYQTIAERNRELLVLPFVGSDDGFQLKHTGPLSELEDREDVIVHRRSHSIGDSMEDLIDLQS